MTVPNFAFGYTISAKDETAGTLRGALKGVTGFARAAAKPITIPLRIGRKGLGLLRDINLGLAPILSKVDEAIARGTGLEAVRKSFAALTGRSAKDAAKLASELARASNGVEFDGLKRFCQTFVDAETWARLEAMLVPLSRTPGGEQPGSPETSSDEGTSQE